MPVRRWIYWLTVLAFATGSPTAVSASGTTRTDKPTVTLTASPAVGFTPLRVVFTAELKGGDNAQLYCPSVEWTWGDETKTASASDCDPYEPGKSEVKRRWVADHLFDMSGEWRVQLRLKQNGKVVAQGSTTIKLRGADDGGDDTIIR